MVFEEVLSQFLNHLLRPVKDSKNFLKALSTLSARTENRGNPPSTGAPWNYYCQIIQAKGALGFRCSFVRVGDSDNDALE